MQSIPWLFLYSMYNLYPFTEYDSCSYFKVQLFSLKIAKIWNWFAWDLNIFYSKKKRRQATNFRWSMESNFKYSWQWMKSYAVVRVNTIAVLQRILALSRILCDWNCLLATVDESDPFTMELDNWMTDLTIVSEQQ